MEENKNSNEIKETIRNVLENNHNRYVSTDPVLNYLLGIAYLNGKDVEVDTKHGVKLLEKAAKAGNIEAMRALSVLYTNGTHIPHDHEKALHWQLEIYDRECKERPAIEALRSLAKLVITYKKLGDKKSELACRIKQYNLHKRYWGKEYENGCKLLEKIASLYAEIGDKGNELIARGELYELAVKIYGEDDEKTLDLLNNLGVCYYNVRDYRNAVRELDSCFSRSCDTLGCNHPSTKAALHNLIRSLLLLRLECEYRNDYKSLINCYQKIYYLYKMIYGENNIETINALRWLAYTYYRMDDHKSELQYRIKLYKLLRDLNGKYDLDTINALKFLAYTYFLSNDYGNAYMHYKKLYKQCRKQFGGLHVSTHDALSSIAEIYDNTGRSRKALSICDKISIHPKYLNSDTTERIKKYTSFMGLTRGLKHLRKIIILMTSFHSF